MEIRREGRSRALRVDGTFASLYRPGRAATGSVWDALVAPLLWLPPHKRRAILVLGLGGGSAARLVRAVAPRARIVGVERSAEVLRAARSWFDLDALEVEVVCEDARRFLARSRRGFDVVIEDVFVGGARDVRKPSWMIAEGLASAARRLRRGGLLIANSIDETPAVVGAMRPLFPALLRVEIEGYDNQVIVGGPRGLSGRTVRSAVGSHRALRDTLPRLRFRRL